MSEGYLIALIGVGGAVLGALIPQIWQYFSKPKTKLSASVTHYSFVIPQYLEESIRAYKNDYYSEKRPSSEARERLSQITSSRGFGMIEIENNSRKLVSGLTLHLGNDNRFISDVEIDGDIRKSQFGTVCDIGTLKPKGKCKVRIWTPYSYLDDSWKHYSYFGAIRVTANEYDKIVLNFPKPPHLKKYFFVRRGPVWAAFWLLLFAYNVISVIYLFRK